MKNLYALLLCLATTNAANAQAYGELDLNDILARFYAHGLIGFDLSSGTSAFEVPKNEGTHPLLSAGLWVGGLSQDDQQHLAAMMREGAGSGDFYPGPLTTDGSASTNATVMAQYDQVHIITREELMRHAAYYHCLVDPNCEVSVEFPDGYTIPPSFFEWPAINTTPLYDTYLAPFVDFNNDGDYTPTDGDMPCIMGDQAAFFVFNDKGGPHMLTGSQPIGLEIRAMPFEFKWDSPALDQTLFVHYQLINQGVTTLHDTYVALYMDLDLGCPDDDLIGSDPARNLMYVYNGNGTDADCLGTSGYGAQPPAFGLTLLRGPFMDHDGVDNVMNDSMPAWNGKAFGDGVVDNERLGLSRAMYFNRDGIPAMTDPTAGAHFYNYLRGNWKDGTPLTTGGNGYGGTVPTRFAFPDNTDPLGVGTDNVPQPAWSETSAGNAPGDRRALSSIGPITMEPGEHMNITFAFVYARAATGGPMASVQALQQRVDSVRTFFYDNPYWLPYTLDYGDEMNLCMGNYELNIAEHQHLSMRLYPNPASASFTLEATARMAGHVLTLHDATGRTVQRQRLVQGSNTLDAGALAPGIYACDVITDQERYTARLVKE